MPGCGEWCEFNASETACFCLRTQSHSICQIISGKRGTDEQREAYRRLVHTQTLEVAWSEPVMPGLPHYTAPQKPGAVTEAVIVTKPVPLAISLAVTKCPHRTKQPNCGCAGKWRCGRYNADVTFHECCQCKSLEALTMNQTQLKLLLADILSRRPVIEGPYFPSDASIPIELAGIDAETFAEWQGGNNGERDNANLAGWLAAAITANQPVE